MTSQTTCSYIILILSRVRRTMFYVHIFILFCFVHVCCFLAFSHFYIVFTFIFKLFWVRRTMFNVHISFVPFFHICCFFEFLHYYNFTLFSHSFSNYLEFEGPCFIFLFSHCFVIFFPIAFIFVVFQPFYIITFLHCFLILLVKISLK